MNTNNLKLNRLAKGVVLAGVLVSSTLTVSANKNKSEASSFAIPPAVKSISSTDGVTTLQVQLENEKKSAFTVVIRDEEGYPLYRKAFNDASFSKTFKVLNDGADAENLTVIISVDGGKSYVYNVYNTVAVVKSIQVTKL